MFVTVKIEIDENRTEMFLYDVDDSTGMVRRMIEVDVDKVAKWQSSLDDNGVFIGPNLIEGEFPDQELWSFTPDCFYSIISAEEFNQEFSRAVQSGTQGSPL